MSETKKTEEKRNKAIGVVVVLFFAFLMTSILWKNDSTEIELITKAETITSSNKENLESLRLAYLDEENDERTFYSVTPELKAQITLQKEDGITPLFVDYVVDTSNNIVSTTEKEETYLEDSTQLKMAADTFDSINIAEADTTSIANEEKTEAPSLNEKIVTIPESTQNTVETEEVKNKRPLTLKEKDCVIIIGAYNEESNADLMRAKLAKDGYSIYSNYRNNMYYIGAEVECSQENISKELKYLRSKFAHDAYSKK